MRIVGDQFLDLGVGLVNVVGLARKCHPAKWPDAAAEQRPNVRRHKTGIGERVFDPVLERDLAEMVYAASESLDFDYVRDWLARILGPVDPRLQRFERIVESGGSELGGP